MWPEAARPWFPRGCLRIGPAGGVLIGQAGAGWLAAMDARKARKARGRAGIRAEGLAGLEGPMEAREKQARKPGERMQSARDGAVRPWKASKTRCRPAEVYFITPGLQALKRLF